MFSNATKYAIRTVIFLAKNDDSQSKLRVVTIAKELNIPKPFLSKILQKLAKANLVSSTKGRGGGFFLTEENRNKTLLDVIVCVEGYNVLNECVLGLSKCSNENPCSLHEYYKKIKQDLMVVVSDATVESLVIGLNDD